MEHESELKNPISILNEFCLKSGIRVEFESKASLGEYIFEVVYKNKVIGDGSDKKKKVAKSKAAESAIKYFKSNTIADSYEKELMDITASMLRKGNFKQVNKYPPFVYEFYIGNMLVATAKDNEDKIAREKCAKIAIEKLVTIQQSPEKEPSEPEFRSKITDQPELPKKRPQKTPDVLIPTDKSCQVEKIHTKDPRIFDQNSSFDTHYQMYCNSLFESFELHQSEILSVKSMQLEVHAISKVLGLEISPLGSNSLNIIRRGKLILDYAVICQGATETEVHSIYECLEKAKLSYLEFNEPDSKIGKIKIISSVEIVENPINPYSKLSYIKLTHNLTTSNLYIFDSKSHPSLIHYKWMKSDPKSSTKLKASALLRHWRQRVNIDIPSELLDLLVENCVSEEMSCGLGFRIVCEQLASGIYLPGALPMTQDSCHEVILLGWPCRLRYHTMKEAVNCLIAISQQELSSFLS